MKKFAFLSIVFLVIAMMTSCKKEPVDAGAEGAPQLPPQESFIMPFTGFEDADTTGFKGKDQGEVKSGPHTYGNWFHAASNVVFWNTLAGLTTAIPVAAFKEAFNHAPTHIGNGVFVWAYDVHHAGKTYIAALSGQFINNGQDTQWEMKISQIGAFTDVVWYTGVVSTDRTEAHWTLNHKPENPEAFLDIDYEYNVVDQTFYIRYTNAISTSPDKGDYIEFRVNADGNFNRGYDVYRGSNLLQIQWDVPSNEGRVKDPAHFMDSDWHCWNGVLIDVEC